MQPAISSSSLSLSPAVSASISRLIRSSPGRPPALANIAAQERDERAGRRDRRVLDGAVAAGRVHRDHAVRPVEEVRRRRDGNAEQLGDDGDRDRRAKGGEQIDRLPGRRTYPIDQLCASAATRGRSRSIWRETKARLTSVRSRVCTGGSRAIMERLSTS